MTLLVPALMRMSWRSLLRSRRFVLACLVGLIPVLLGLALLASDANLYSQIDPRQQTGFDSRVSDALAFLVLGGTIPLIAMLMAGSIVADDVEDRTFSYVLVRPLRRHQVYLSRLVPAVALVAALAVLQVLAFLLLRLLSWSMHGQGMQDSVYIDGAYRSVDALDAILGQAGFGAMAALFAAVAFTALFGFVTVLTTRYHFLANVLAFASVELLFGNLGGRGAGIVTITYHARSALYAAGGEPHYHAAPWWASLLVLAIMVAFWTLLAAWRMGRRDFNVTSAAS